MSWIDSLRKLSPEQGGYSQYGESTYIDYILKNIGTTNNHFVDIGANNGEWFSNTRHLLDRGWTGLMLDGQHENQFVRQHFVTKENINFLLKRYETPESFDLLSIDIDGNDYWVLREVLTKYSPRVIISEFNSELDIDACKTIKYNPDFTFENNIYYGYSFLAGEKLAKEFGYKVIHQTSNLNLYMIKEDLLPEGEYTIPNYQKFKWWGGETDKEWVEL